MWGDRLSETVQACPQWSLFPLLGIRSETDGPWLAAEQRLLAACMGSGNIHDRHGLKLSCSCNLDRSVDQQQALLARHSEAELSRTGII